jgi:hypothetical protein
MSGSPELSASSELLAGGSINQYLSYQNGSVLRMREQFCAANGLDYADLYLPDRLYHGLQRPIVVSERPTTSIARPRHQ